MFKVKKKDMFAKNMSNAELYKSWQKLKAQKEFDEWMTKLIAKNGTTNY